MTDESLPKYILLWREHPQDLCDFINERCAELDYVLVSTFTSMVYGVDHQGKQIIVGQLYNAIIGRKDSETK